LQAGITGSADAQMLALAGVGSSVSIAARKRLELI
jgi:molybdopterin/thiamine biosynthesis adenylyltransferase